MAAGGVERVRETSSIEVVPVSYGADAAAALHRRVADAKAGDPLAPVTVLVGSNYVGVAARRRLASGEGGPVTEVGSGIAGITLLTVYRLAELLGAPTLAASGRRPVSTPVLGAALRACLTEAPGVFVHVATHPATEEALVAAFRDLSDLSAGELEAVAGRSRRAADVVGICTGARRRLESGWYDEADLVRAATSAASAAPLTSELGTVVVYLPQEMTRSQAGLIRAVAGRTRVVVMAGRTGRADADAGVRKVLGELGAASNPYDTYLPVGTDAAGSVGTGLEVVSTSDADDEVRAVVRRIVDAARAGVPLERIAVLYGSAEPYARLLHEQFDAAGLAFNGRAARRLPERLAGRFLLDAVSLGDEGFRRGDVMALIAGAPVRRRGGGYVPSSMWQRVSRAAGVVEGDDWDHRLRTHAEDLARAEEEAAVGSRSGLVERNRREAEAARELREFVADLRARVEAGRRLETWAALACWARRFMTDLLGGEAARTSWPAPERRAADQVEAALDRLAGLDGIAGAPDMDVFRRTLALELDSDLGRVGRLGEGVLVGGTHMGLALDADMVFVLGLAEGVLPAPPGEDTLLADSDRAAVPDALPSRDDRLARQHRDLLTALASARRTCVLTFPRGDLRASAERMPSRWLLDAVEARTGSRGLQGGGTTSASGAQVEQVPSFAAGIVKNTSAATDQEFRLRQLAGGDAAALVRRDPVLRGAFELVAQRRSAAFTRFDGNLAGLPVGSPTESTVSATRLESYVACPHAYLLHRILRVGVLDDPEEQLTISRLDEGSLVHEVLERFVSGAIAAGAVPAPGEPWPRRDRDRLESIFDAVAGRYEARGQCGHARFWPGARARMRADLHSFLQEDAKLRTSHGARPVHVELAFGEAGGPDVSIELRDGRRLRFAGKIDRVDECEDGTLLVLDYKTGSDKSYTKLSESDPDNRGARLQLPVYGVAARVHTGRGDAAVAATYWFVTKRRRFACHGFEVTDAVLDRYRDVIDTVVAGIEGGVFPARPHETKRSGHVLCPHCDPDGLGTADLAKSWERKHRDPALGRLVALVEPDTAEDADGV